MSYYIYLFCDRIVYWAPHSANTGPVDLPTIKWYALSIQPPVPFDELIKSECYGYSLNKGYYTIETPPPLAWVSRGSIVRKIQILMQFSVLAISHKMHFSNATVGQSLTEVLIFDEIAEYRRSRNFENCTILQSMLETGNAKLTPEALVTKLWLKNESYRTIVAYLERLEFKVRELLSNGSYDAAAEIIDDELEKLWMM